jgi:hypothetical protein
VTYKPFDWLKASDLSFFLWAVGSFAAQFTSFYGPRPVSKVHRSVVPRVGIGMYKSTCSKCPWATELVVA